MTLDDAGNIYVAGGFTNAADEQYVAKWNGSNWRELGTGTNGLHANSLIYALATDNAGNVYATGHFTNSNGKYYLAKYNGTNWTELGPGSPLNANDPIRCMTIDNSDNIYCAGDFKNSSAEYYVAKWDGTNWAELGAGINILNANCPIKALAVNTNCIFYVFLMIRRPPRSTQLAKWDGSGWSEVFSVASTTNTSIQCIGVDNGGNVYAAGNFKNNGGHSYVAKWDGYKMSEPGRGSDNLNAYNGINQVAVTPKGEVYATLADASIAHWDGRTWSELGGLNLNGYVVITTDLSGNLYVGGDFTDQNGKYYIAKWDGHSWSVLGDSSNPIKIYSPIALLTTDKMGNVYAAGNFGDDNAFGYYIMKWNGSDYTLIESSFGPKSCLLVDDDGNIYAGIAGQDGDGKFSVEKIDQNGEVVLGTGLNSLDSRTAMTALALDARGNLLAGGLNNAGKGYRFVAKWDGTKWSESSSDSTSKYADGYVKGMLSDDSGYVYAASATNSNSVFSVARWDGNNWKELGNGQDLLHANGIIGSIAKDGRDNIYAAGLFNNSNNQQYVAVYGKSVLILQQPELSPGTAQYCHTNGMQTINILNLPDTFFISVTAKLDNNPIPINSATSITFNPSTLSLGSHRLRIYYSTRTDTMFATKDFTVVDHITPEVDIAASATTVLNPNPIVITAINTSGGGASPLFTFASDRNMSSILQAESVNNIFMLDPAVLSSGENRIYVRMRTSDVCYTVQTNIDSITITNSVATGIIDVDYPNHEIYVYPNPFRETFSIKGLQVSKSYSISIANSMGQIIYREIVRNSTNTTITKNISRGSYWIIIHDDSRKKLLGILPLIKQ